MKEKIIIDLKFLQQRTCYHRLKRIFDVFVSLLALLVLWPVFLVIGILIKLEDGGQVIFSQERVGKNGQVFKMYKFRSMHMDAETRLATLLAQNEVEGPMFKMKNDPRVTRIGRFLRKTSLDEFPQLINVCLGQMSLVGPRPPLVREVAQYTPYDKQRLLVTPGCTGWWQVTARNHTGFTGMVKRDLEYIQKANLWLDLKIICLTVKVVLVPNGAY